MVIAKRMCALLTVLCLLVLCGCQKTDVSETDPTGDINSAEQNGLSDLTDPQAVDMSSILSAGEASEALDLTVTGPELSQDKTIASYQNETGSLLVELSAQRADKADFDEMIAGIDSETSAAPNLGEEAFWIGEFKVLYTYASPYMFSVTVRADTVSQDNALILSRQITVAMMEKLH